MVRIQFVADFGPEKGKTRACVNLPADYDTIMQKAQQMLQPKGSKKISRDHVLVLKDVTGPREIIQGVNGLAIPLGGVLDDGAIIALTSQRPTNMPAIAPNSHVCIACKGAGLLFQELCPLCDGACAFACDVLEEGCGQSWPELPMIQGRGRYEGEPPRSAGIIAICEIEGTRYVCICEKGNGKASFPKGGLDGETVLVGAKREWREEAGLSLNRLQFLSGVSLDEPRIGCRYLLARCSPPDPRSNEPDKHCLQWKPPFEDPDDRDPIVKSQWVRVREASRLKLLADRCRLLEEAVGQLESGSDFFNAELAA